MPIIWRSAAATICEIGRHLICVLEMDLAVGRRRCLPKNTQSSASQYYKRRFLAANYYYLDSTSLLRRYHHASIYSANFHIIAIFQAEGSRQVRRSRIYASTSAIYSDDCDAAGFKLRFQMTFRKMLKCFETPIYGQSDFRWSEQAIEVLVLS